MNAKELDKIRQIIRQELKEALTVEVKMERFDKESGIKEIKEEKVFLPIFWTEFLPVYSAALRGMQEDLDHAKNDIQKQTIGMKSMTDILLEHKNSIIQIAKYAKVIEDNDKLIDLRERKKLNESNSKG